MILTIGFCGACRKDEIMNLKPVDFIKQGDLIQVNIVKSKNDQPRSFVISQEFIPLIQEYQSLRPSICTVERFLVRYQDGKCMNQPIGKKT